MTARPFLHLQPDPLRPTGRRPARDRKCPRTARGLTLLELLVVGSLLAALLVAGLPSFQGFLLRRHLLGHSAQLLADLQWLRASAVARHEALRISWLQSAAGSGWVLHAGAAGSCRPSGDPAEPVACDNGSEPLRQVWLPADSRVGVQANVASMRLDPRQGTLTPTGSWELSTMDGQRLRHVVNLLGRVRVCTPGASIGGVPPC
ncbi:MAG: GspH/FimT family pseudopilin [Burkholderiaceae bacterium]|nr:GspH/FimT family pseudopilin [Burkholderiaceae bacterium]